MIKKYRNILIGILIPLLIIAGCYINAKRPIILTIGLYAGSSWNVYDNNSYQVFDEAIKRFEEVHPNVTIEYESGIRKDDYAQWLADKIVNGNVPDIMLVPNTEFNTLASIGALAPLDELFDRKEVSDFYPQALETGIYDGILYALPYACNPMMMCVNYDILVKESVDMPKADWTIEDLSSISERVTKDTDNNGVIDQYGCYKYTWRDALAGYGMSVVNNEGTRSNLNDPYAREALKYVQKLNALNNGYQISVNDFDSGKVAFTPMSSAQYRTYKSYPYRISKYTNFAWECIPMPSGSESDTTSIIETALIGISRGSHQTLAKEFVKMMSTDEEIQFSVLKNTASCSVRRSIMQSEEADELLRSDTNDILNAKTIDEIMNRTFTQPYFKNYSSIMDTADYLLSKSIMNQSVDSDLNTINKTLEEKLKE